jgi:hypothetical protein
MVGVVELGREMVSLAVRMGCVSRRLFDLRNRKVSVITIRDA